MKSTFRDGRLLPAAPSIPFYNPRGAVQSGDLEKYLRTTGMPDVIRAKEVLYTVTRNGFLGRT